MKKNHIIAVVFSLLISLGLIWLLFSRIDAKDLISTLNKIFLPYLLVYIAFSLFNSILRAIRYRWLLAPLPASFGSIFVVTLIRNLFVDLLPARLGSLSYVYLVNRRLHFPFEFAASSFLLSMVFDFFTLSPFLIIAVFAVGIGINILSGPAILAVSLLFMIIMGFILIGLPGLIGWGMRIYGNILERTKAINKPWAHTSLEKWKLTIDSLKEAKKRGIYGKVFFISIILRATKYGALYFLLAALMRFHGFGLNTLSVWKTILGITGAEMTSILPVKGIGGFGTWESAWALAFELMNFESRLAVISGIGVHLITNIFEYSLGIISILILALPFFRNKFSGNSRYSK